MPAARNLSSMSGVHGVSNTTDEGRTSRDLYRLSAPFFCLLGTPQSKEAWKSNP